jgi:hypothetical protein
MARGGAMKELLIEVPILGVFDHPISGPTTPSIAGVTVGEHIAHSAWMKDHRKPYPFDMHAPLNHDDKTIAIIPTLSEEQKAYPQQVALAVNTHNTMVNAISQIIDSLEWTSYTNEDLRDDLECTLGMVLAEKNRLENRSGYDKENCEKEICNKGKASVMYELNSSGKHVVFVNGHALHQGDLMTAYNLAKELGLEFFTQIDRRTVPFKRTEIPVTK